VSPADISTPVEVPPLDALEVSSGAVFGRRRTFPDEIERRPTAGARETLEEILLEGLQRPPCVVAFSGGRDSSALLAEVTRLARKYGLDDPVPYTLRFGNAPRTDETEWQEMVIRHLGLQDWGTRAVVDELDALGPLALDVLRRHGPHWPANAHTFGLLLEPAAGGSLVTGNGGDELFTAWGGRLRTLMLRGKARPRRADLKPLLIPYLPMAVLSRRPRFQLPWLRPDAAGKVARSFATNLKSRHSSWAETLEGYLHSRYYELAVGITAGMAAAADVRLVQPFYDPRYVRSIYADAPREGYPSRAFAMKRHFGDVLPPQLPRRLTKATFTEVFTGPRTRRFAAEWDGSGLDSALVDPERLREQWLSPKPDLRTLVPLQAAWLANPS
jgi:asparagine synthetase B (glutamine-hydrolysing)